MDSNYLNDIDDLPPPIPVSQEEEQEQDITVLPVAIPVVVGTEEEEVVMDDSHLLKDEEKINCLKQQGFTTGLAKALLQTCIKQHPLRIWVVDNSGSMIKDDGRRIVETQHKHNVKLVPCTRWSELQECVTYHAQIAALLNAPTHFRLLNNPGISAGPQYFKVADDDGGGGGNNQAKAEMEASTAISIIRKVRPYGVTPLTEHVTDIYNTVSALAPTLRNTGQKVVIIFATDGLPSDDQGHGGRFISDQFVQALRLLQSLPVWVVIRLCTNENEVVRFYEELDTTLELSVEVLDDFVDEAKEVHKHNPWLNYALPLHRCREMGFHDRLFDLLDERTLTKAELYQFCCLLFGGDLWDDGVPDPEIDWDGFTEHLESMLLSEECQWSPISKKVGPWIDMKTLQRTYGVNNGVNW
eukprot:CAMPEP_0185726140 /NCGR_PEP_ID=MMETSP1171-20130828/2204_1 /TAXON_ID=374046 /ORGANISM="Helicotheca tamensis, Strain CCMP826" /LENGTH=411 /DNA_ID=CAMNT_0028394429 /DNA_START=231 /DNA_END=1463 /DNA_ORIENTATION=-